jgi:prepilin peptidase CpaA
MTTSVLSAVTAMAVFAFAMLYAGLTDLTKREISNRLVLLLLIAYAILAPFAGFPAYEIGWSFVAALGVLLGAIALFALGLIGGGDAKLAAVTALWLGADHTLAYLLYAALLGGAFALGVLGFRGLPLPSALHSRGWIGRLHARGTGVPYGVTMVMAALLVFPATRWMAGLT